MPLHSMQDLAGFRVVGVLSFADQDRLAAEIARRFPADPREPRIRDRRAEPSYGYRAVHVIVSLDDVTIEVQVRTLGQHMWADLMERLADRLGRQIRYGDAPAPQAGRSPEAAQIIVGAMMSLSETCELACGHAELPNGLQPPDWREHRPGVPCWSRPGVDPGAIHPRAAAPWQPRH
jgi:ppGpp synthetase/RelA/SpoT-type nucleotidyltranferase